VTTPAWTADHANLVGLADVLVDAGWLDTAKDVVYFFQKPWKYDEQWQLWDACQQPGLGDTNWAWFTAKLEGQE
jgi:hypothetical protein